MSNNAVSIWEKCLAFISDNISEQAFQTWFLPIKATKATGDILTIEVPSKFFYEWLEEHYVDLLKISLSKTMGPGSKLVYSIAMESNNPNKIAKTVNIPSSRTYKTSLQEVNRSYSTAQIEVKNPFIIPGLQKIKIDSQLNSIYNFDFFIEGDSNRLARSAGLAIAENPGGTSFNPLFIHGAVGQGKTHLCHAIGLEIKAIHPEKTVLYVTTEKFIQQFVEAVRNNNRNDFIQFYQLIDVLIMDDIQFLSGKPATQDVFFHIFNHLHQRGQQIILTSDKPPIEIQDIEQRLISRFKWGLSAELQKPEYSLRLEYLKFKSEKDGIEMPESVLELLAKHIKVNIRELHGALIWIIAQATLNKKEINDELAEVTISNFVSNSRKEISIDYIQNVVSKYFKIPIEDLQSKSRKRDIVQARHTAMYFAKKHTNASLASIGSKIGKRDHATVLHACKTVNNLAETNKLFKGYLEDIKRVLTSD